MMRNQGCLHTSGHCKLWNISGVDMILKSVLFKAVHLCSALSSGDLSISLPLRVEADLVDMSCHDVLYIYNTGHFYLVRLNSQWWRDTWINRRKCTVKIILLSLSAEKFTILKQTLISACMQAHIHMRVCMRAHAHTHTHTFTHTRARTDTDTHRGTHALTHIRTGTHTNNVDMCPKPSVWNHLQ